MCEIKKGDAVTRKSYGNDIVFSVKQVIKLTNQKNIAILKGINVRVEADAPIEDLVKVSKKERMVCERQLKDKIDYKVKYDKVEEKRREKIVYMGRILHLDGELLYYNVAWNS